MISIGLRTVWEFGLSIFGLTGTHLYQFGICPGIQKRVFTVMDMPRPSSGSFSNLSLRTSPTPWRRFNEWKSCKYTEQKTFHLSGCENVRVFTRNQNTRLRVEKTSKGILHPKRLQAHVCLVWTETSFATEGRRGRKRRGSPFSDDDPIVPRFGGVPFQGRNFQFSCPSILH